MRKIATIAWKDALARFSSRSEILFFLVLPLLFTFISGGGLSGGGEADDRIPLLVVDEDGSELAAELLSALATSESVRTEVVTRAEAEAQFEDEAAPALLTIPAGFEAALLTGKPVELDLRKASSDTDAAVAEQAIRVAAGTVSRALAVAGSSVVEAERAHPFADEAERQAYFAQSLSMAQTLFESAPERVEVTQPAAAIAESNGGFDFAAHASAGQLVTWVFIPLLGTSVVFAYERSMGTLRRLLTTPTRKSTFLLGTTVGQLGMGIVQMALLISFGVLVMRVNWGQSLAALAVMLVTFGLASVAFGTMLATFVKTESQASGISIMLGMSMALLGGCWLPMEIFPEVARTAAKVLPTTWAMQGLTDIVRRGQGLAEVLPEAGVLLGFAVVFFAIGVRRLRFE